MVARADAISCATPEQQTTLGMFNDNVHPILDIQDGDLGAKKDNYEVGPTINLVWDGLATNLDAFAHVVDVLRKINDTTSLAVHVVTNIEYKPVNGPVPALPTTRLLSKYLDGVKTYLYQWNSHTVAQLCAACDIAIIPMKRGSPVHMAKPENKLLYYWRVGLPTIVERTSAYDRTMTGANLDYCCSSGDEWERKLTRLIASQTERKAVAQEGREYAERVQGTEILLSKWDALFTSILS